MSLAKIISPVYDANAELWREITIISTKMKIVKTDLEDIKYKQVIKLSESDTSSNLYLSF